MFWDNSLNNHMTRKNKRRAQIRDLKCKYNGNIFFGGEQDKLIKRLCHITFALTNMYIF